MIRAESRRFSGTILVRRSIANSGALLLSRRLIRCIPSIDDRDLDLSRPMAAGTANDAGSDRIEVLQCDDGRAAGTFVDASPFIFRSFLLFVRHSSRILINNSRAARFMTRRPADL